MLSHIRPHATVLLCAAFVLVAACVIPATGHAYRMTGAGAKLGYTSPENLDGTLHMKSHDRKVLSFQGQPLTGIFRGTEHLGADGGFGPKSVGAICDPSAFSGIVEVAPGVLGPRDGRIMVDLIEPGQEPADVPWIQIIKRQVFRDFEPWVMITVGSQHLP